MTMLMQLMQVRRIFFTPLEVLVRTQPVQEKPPEPAPVTAHPPIIQNVSPWNGVVQNAEADIKPTIADDAPMPPLPEGPKFNLLRSGET